VQLAEYRRVIMDLCAHSLLTGFLSVVIYQGTRNASYVAFFILGGILIDLDHFIDYFIFYKRNFRFSDFFGCAYLVSGKVYVLFHSWELAVFIFMMSIIVPLPLLFFLSLGLTVHLVIDNLQRQNRLFCFLIYRCVKRFDAHILLPELYPA
jgi:hypothetical protein